MADPFGVSFLPGGDAQYQRPRQGVTQPLQEAIKVLSLRVPRVVGANPLAPLALLQGQGGGGMPSGIVETLLRALSQSPQGAPPVAAVPGPETPQAPMPTLGAPPVPQPAAPPMMGAPPVRPSVTGAPSAMAARPAAAPPAPFATPPTPSITIGATAPPPVAEEPPIVSGPPVPPEGPLDRPGAEEFWALARRLRGGFGREV